MIDVGVLGSPLFEADVSQKDVAAAAKENLDALKTERDRGRSVAAMAVGAKAILERLFERGAIHGVASLGGSAGTAIATAAMRALPYGFPKLMVSTLASGDIKPYVGTKGICMMPSVLDIAGLNHVSRRIISMTLFSEEGPREGVHLEHDTESRGLDGRRICRRTPPVYRFGRSRSIAIDYLE